MVTLDHAEGRVVRAAKTLPARQVEVDGARGYILARAVAAPSDLPGVPLAAEDGFAVRSEDLAAASPLFPVMLRLIGEGNARSRGRSSITPGRALRVCAFDPVPRGADAVVAAEGARENRGSHVEVVTAVSAGDNVISRGSEIRRGESLLRRGQELAAEDLGLLASMGVTAVSVYPRPRVGTVFLGAGRSLPGRRPGPGEVPDGNLLTIGAAVESAGGVARRLGIWPLKSRQVIAALERHARTLDLLVTTGGVSPHGQDSLAAWIANAGGRIVFSEINVTPGRACLLARLGRCVLVALPGDPRGALVGLHFIVMPILQRMRGRPGPYIHWDEARLASPVRNHADIPRLLPGRVLPAAGGGLTVTPESERRLGSLRGVDGMNGFILLPPSMPPQAAGARVKVARFNP